MTRMTFYRGSNFSLSRTTCKWGNINLVELGSNENRASWESPYYYNTWKYKILRSTYHQERRLGAIYLCITFSSIRLLTKGVCVCFYHCTLLDLIDFLTWFFCLLKLLIFYQKVLWNIKSRLKSSTFWVFEPIFRY